MTQDQDQDPFEIMNPDGDPSLLLVCDHASNYLPPEYNSLGLPLEQMDRHIAYDIGAADVTRRLSRMLGVPAVLSRFSRLLIDPNRGEDDPTLVMRISDGAIVPGNRDISRIEIERRLERYYRPYHRVVDRQLDRMVMGLGAEPAILSVHSFTPYWKGILRPWHFSILWESDGRLVAPLLHHLNLEPGLTVGENVPYRGSLSGDSMDRHGINRNLAHAVIEIRQNLVNTKEGVERASGLLRRVMQSVLTDLQSGHGRPRAREHRLRA